MCMWAKLLPSCLTLCNPVDCCPPGSSVHGILQPRIWILDLPDPRTGPAPPATPALAGRFFPAELSGKPERYHKQSEERSLQRVWGIRNVQNQQTISQRNKSVRKSVEKRQPSRKIGKECKEANHRKKTITWMVKNTFIHASFHNSQGMRMTQIWESGTTQGLWGYGRGREPWVGERWAVTHRWRLWGSAEEPCSSEVPSSLSKLTGAWFWIGGAHSLVNSLPRPGAPKKPNHDWGNCRVTEEMRGSESENLGLLRTSGHML